MTEETQWSADDLYTIMEFAFYMGEEVSGTSEQLLWTTNLQKLLDKTKQKIKMLEARADRAENLLDLIEQDLSCDFNEYIELLEEKG